MRCVGRPSFLQSSKVLCPVANDHLVLRRNRSVQDPQENTPSDAPRSNSDGFSSTASLHRTDSLIRVLPLAEPSGQENVNLRKTLIIRDRQGQGGSLWWTSQCLCGSAKKNVVVSTTSYVTSQYRVKCCGRSGKLIILLCGFEMEVLEYLDFTISTGAPQIRERN